MKRSSSVSRRELFRNLGRSGEPKWLGEPHSVQTPADETLREPLPEQPVSADDEPYELPPVRQAILDDAELAALFRDLEHSATDVQWNRRVAVSKGSANGSPTGQLRAVHQALRDGSLARVQIRYRWRGAFWIDTLHRVDQAYRLVRVAHR